MSEFYIEMSVFQIRNVYTKYDIFKYETPIYLIYKNERRVAPVYTQNLNTLLLCTRVCMRVCVRVRVRVSVCV